MRRLDFLRDVRTVWQQVQTRERTGGEEMAPMPDGGLRCLVESAPSRGTARLVHWFDDGARGMWTEIRWPGRRRIGGVLVRIRLPGKGSAGTSWSLAWIARLSGAVDALAADFAPFQRPIRLHVSSRATDAKVGPRPAWTGRGRDAALIDIDFSKARANQSGTVVRAGGLVGDVLAAVLGRSADETTDLPLSRTKIAIDGSDALSDIGAALATTLLWWSTAGLDESYRLFQWLQHAVPASVHAYAAMRWDRRSNVAADAAALAYALEARLDGMWQLVSHFEPRAVGEEEIAGWVREVEAAFRYTLPALRSASAHGQITGGGKSGDELPERGAVWVVSADHRPAGERGQTTLLPRRLPRRGHSAPAPGDIFDGERTLVEGVHLLHVRWGFAEDAARKIVRHWIDSGLIRPLDERGRDRRTVMYFAFGSCMCLPSFRETVPQYDLLGPARLRGHRLAFTFESVGRNGGVADVVPEPGADVWGVLYRIPRSYVPMLDAREGVGLGYYQRSWIDVEAFGLTWSPVLTYTVATKARSEIRPSDEYAGLIMEGAQTLLDSDYCRRLADMFSGFGVEPSLPL